MRLEFVIVGAETERLPFLLGVLIQGPRNPYPADYPHSLNGSLHNISRAHLEELVAGLRAAGIDAVIRERRMEAKPAIVEPGDRSLYSLLLPRKQP